MHDSRMWHLDMLASLLNPRNWEQQKHFCHVVMVMKRESQLDVEKNCTVSTKSCIILGFPGMHTFPYLWIDFP